MHVVVSGASGLIGTALGQRLRRSGHTVTALVRRPAGAGEIQWDPAAGRLADGALNGVDAVVNLAGAGINDHRWTDEYKRTLVDSRIRGTELLTSVIAAATNPPATFISGSGVGYYGARGDDVLDERSSAGDDFLASLCVRWEAAALAATAAGARVATLRTGIVLSARGGALKKQLPLFKFGLGGKFGSGRQWQSWISIDDEVGAIEFLLSSPEGSRVAGPVNLVAPSALTNAEFTSTLGSVLRRPTFLPIPSAAPKLLLGGELADALLFTGQHVVPRVLESSGYSFQHATLEQALRSQLGR